MTASKSKHTYASVWKTLSAIDCSEKAEKKNGLTYLSWAWAWGILMEHYPEATYQFLNEEWDSEGRATVWCSVKIGELDRLDVASRDGLQEQGYREARHQSRL